MQRIIDISQKISAETAVYPGDPRYHSRLVSSFRQGDGCEVSEICIGTHIGTHVDAPSHMISGGGALESLPLDCFIGPCRVLSLNASVISEKMIHELNIQRGERILLRTDPRGWYSQNERFNPSVLSLRAAQQLASIGVKLIGLDAPTVENMEMCDGEVHRTLLRAGIAILEGLCLQDAVDEHYFLSAMPLRLEGENGAPCRAVLIEMDK